jgi:hypothetical protein
MKFEVATRKLSNPLDSGKSIEKGWCGQGYWWQLRDWSSNTVYGEA